MAALASGLSLGYMTSTSVALGLAVVTPILIVAIAWIDLKRKTQKPTLSYQPTKFNEGVMSRMPTLKQLYRPMLFLTNGHVETIFAAKFRRACDLVYRRENVFMPDGGHVALDWRCTPAGEAELAQDAAVLILLPGLTGGSDDTYVRYAVKYAHSIGLRAVVFNSRGCGDTFLSTPQFYSGLFIEDLKHVVAHVRSLYPDSQMFATGWSLGANILVNYLGLVGEDTPLAAAAALCNPFNLTIGDANLRKGFNRLYDWNLARAMSRIMLRNRKVWNGAEGFNVDVACDAYSVRQWDEAITMVSFGFPTVDAYYAAAGSYQRVSGVKIPLLVLQAEDDPIAPIEATPRKALYDNPNCILAVTTTGGHLGWCSGEGGYFGEPWTDRIIVEWLQACQLQLLSQLSKRTPDATASSISTPNGRSHHNNHLIPESATPIAAEPELPEPVPFFVDPATPATASSSRRNNNHTPRPESAALSDAVSPPTLQLSAARGDVRQGAVISTRNGAKSLEAALNVRSGDVAESGGSPASPPSSIQVGSAQRGLMPRVAPLQALQADQFSGGYPLARKPGLSSLHATSNHALGMRLAPIQTRQRDQYSGGHPLPVADTSKLLLLLKAGSLFCVLLSLLQPMLQSMPTTSAFDLPANPTVALGTSTPSRQATAGDSSRGGDADSDMPATPSGQDADDVLELRSLERDMEAMYARISPVRAVDAQPIGSPLRGSVAGRSHGSASSPLSMQPGHSSPANGSQSRQLSPGKLWWTDH